MTKAQLRAELLQVSVEVIRENMIAVTGTIDNKKLLPIMRIAESFFFPKILNAPLATKYLNETIGHKTEDLQLILKITAEIRFLSGLSKTEWDKVLMDLGEVTTYNTRNEAHSVMAGTTAEEVEPYGKVGELVQSNPWMYTVFIIPHAFRIIKADPRFIGMMNAVDK